LTELLSDTPTILAQPRTDWKDRSLKGGYLLAILVATAGWLWFLAWCALQLVDLI
jgi:hypothetical protein